MELHVRAAQGRSSRRVSVLRFNVCLIHQLRNEDRLLTELMYQQKVARRQRYLAPFQMNSSLECDHPGPKALVPDELYMRWSVLP
jgi:hypothetical protein